jgi:hypothetical protein
MVQRPTMQLILDASFSSLGADAVLFFFLPSSETGFSETLFPGDQSPVSKSLS